MVAALRRSSVIRSTRAPFECRRPDLVLPTARHPRYGAADVRTSHGPADPMTIL
jgi:hypothetical protein